MYDEFVLNKAYFINVIKDLAQMVEENRDYLTGLDSQIGDGDHGTNLTIGFREVTKNLEQWEKENIAFIFKKVGMALLGKVGGAAGPLYGSMFMKLGDPVVGKDEVNFKELYSMFKSGIEAVEMRGKAVVGEKTMVDSLRPGLDAFGKAIEEGVEPLKAFEIFVETAKKGSDSTIPIIAKKGRAMRLGERAIGHRDPGSTSSYMILEVFYKNLQAL